MSENVLISPLGQSPGAVSGVALALINDGYTISRVITVGTSHPKVIAAGDILANLFEEVNLLYEPEYIEQSELRDTDSSADAFMVRMGQVLEKVNDGICQVHVAVTGGRSGMGALAALAASLYGADYLWHLWVRDDIARGGDLDRLAGAHTLDNIFLNPTLEDGACELVELSFLDLRRLHPFIKAFREADKVPDPTSPLFQLFGSGDIRRLADVFPATMPIQDADRILEMSLIFPTTNPDKQLALAAELGGILVKANISDKQMTDRLLHLIRNGATPDQLLAAARYAKDKQGFWHWLGANKDQLGAISSVGTFLLKGLELWLKRGS
jgi:hypothetical protein